MTTSENRQDENGSINHKNEIIVVKHWKDAVWHKKIPPSIKLFLLCLKEYAWGYKTRCYPSVPTIADDMNCSERSVYSYIQEALKTGFLKKTKRFLGKDNNEYILLLPDPYHFDNMKDFDSENGVKITILKQNEESSPLQNFQGTPAKFSPEQNNITKQYNKKNKQKKEGVEEEFEIWWKEWPNKEKKPKACELYQKARKEVSAEILLEGLKKYNLHLSIETWKKAQSPITWLGLKNRGWETEYGNQKENVNPYMSYMTTGKSSISEFS